jgi:chloride channel protein, CIC family
MMIRLLTRLRSMLQYESNILVITAVAVGVLAGVGAIVLEFALRIVGQGLLGDEHLEGLSTWRVAIAPAIGALVAGPLIAKFANEAKGHGVPEVMQAVALKGGRIRGRVAVVKTIASAFTIGSGGSAGREGPIVQIGATLGSKIAQMMRMSEGRTRTLVACGAAGAIAAAFNAPLAGVFFALEVILQRFTSRGFATVVLSAVTASVVWRTAFGNAPVLDVPEFGLRNPVELLFYIGLGILAAFVAMIFVKVLYASEDRFDAWRFPDGLKPFIGALGLGAFGVVLVKGIGSPLVYGNGIPGINLALANDLTWKVLLVLLAGKMLATCLTLGSGASGGVFAPSLFMGAMLGGVIGQLVNAILPNATARPGAYAMVGMAAVFAAAAQAPISSVLIIFEMTNDYRIMLPLMLAVGVATTFYTLLMKESIYSLKLARRGIQLREGRETHLMDRVSVRTAIQQDYPTLVWPPTPDQVRQAVAHSGFETVVVVDDAAALVGCISHGELRLWQEEGIEGKSLEDLLDRGAPGVLADESLETAFSRLAPRGVRVAPVLEGVWSRRVIGVVTRQSLLGAYWSAVEDRSSRPDPS